MCRYWCHDSVFLGPPFFLPSSLLMPSTHLLSCPARVRSTYQKRMYIYILCTEVSRYLMHLTCCIPALTELPIVCIVLCTFRSRFGLHRQLLLP
ncbi:uncharacterized protein LY79DRAFT_542085 [Colletotrichum navitas]|uniref:Uncharacterized protein n=1 Tax=Colletotrichum navitas TaxID=681940 RepID=A0AAD8Q9M2_9PEZI|nr:uncharacterized protein LY79DRAFT_542085 [Colletotrichum navitas]KAK1597074.1 hypothetical protein LY79DRAFT_542085 [Colletotrichum navitas]